MPKLIDKDELVSKIVKKIETTQTIINNCGTNNLHPNVQCFYNGRKEGYEQILEIIDEISSNDDCVINLK